MSYYYLSYHDRDLDFVEDELLPVIQSSEYPDTMSIRDIDPYSNKDKEINSAINRAFAVILVVSRHSMKSEDNLYEGGYAHYINKPIIPVMVESPEVIGADGKLKVVYNVHEKLSRLKWFNFSDENHMEWGGFKAYTPQPCSECKRACHNSLDASLCRLT